MNFRGRMPWVAPESYVPSIVEWGVSIGLIAATIFLFGLAARLMPVLPRRSPARHIEVMTPDPWLEAHSYLRPVADLSAEVDRAAAGIESSTPAFPTGMTTARTFSPACRCSRAPMPPSISNRAAEWRQRFSGRLPPDSSGWLAADARALDAELRHEPQASRRIADFLLGDETLGTVVHPGCCAIWAGRRWRGSFRPVVNGFDGWRDEERWLRRYCPTCGSLPAMAQLVGADPAASACSRAAAAARAGSSSEPAARSVKPTLNGSRV